MQIAILAVPDCPNAPLLAQRVRAALEDNAAVIELVEIGDERRATTWGMAGSPTLLIDGVDPFAVPGVEPSLSCRLYRTPDGAVAGAPSVGDLRRVLLTPRAGPDPAAAVWLESVSRGEQGRLAPADGGLRAVQQAILQSLGESGQLPRRAELDRLAAGHGHTVEQVLADLAAADFLTLDEAGRVRAAYPFSTLATRHAVAVDGGPSLWSMCAIDALGVAAMLGRSVTLTTGDLVTGEEITVRATPTGATWDPPRSIVFAGRHAGRGPAAALCCGAINIFASPISAARWAALHPEVSGGLVGVDDAADLGRRIFGPLLERDR